MMDNNGNSIEFVRCPMDFHNEVGMARDSWPFKLVGHGGQRGRAGFCRNKKCITFLSVDLK